jgi:type I restriction enzyme S subunit
MCVDFWDSRRVPIKQEERNQIEGDIPYYGASGVIDYVDDYLFDDDLILVGEDGENVVSRHLPLVFKITGKSWVNNHAHVLKPKAGMDIDYLTEMLEAQDYSLLVSGSAQPKLNQRNLSYMLVRCPEELEQKEIGKSISAINSGIYLFERERKKLSALKRGLMDDLLTGKVRVTELLKKNKEQLKRLRNALPRQNPHAHQAR